MTQKLVIIGILMILLVGMVRGEGQVTPANIISAPTSQFQVGGQLQFDDGTWKIIEKVTSENGQTRVSFDKSGTGAFGIYSDTWLGLVDRKYDYIPPSTQSSTPPAPVQSVEAPAAQPAPVPTAQPSPAAVLPATNSAPQTPATLTPPAPVVQPTSIPADFKGTVLSIYSSQFEVGDWYKTKTGEFKRITKISYGYWGIIPATIVEFGDSTSEKTLDYQPSKIIKSDQALHPTIPGETPTNYVQRNIAEKQKALTDAQTALASDTSNPEKQAAVVKAKADLDGAREDTITLAQQTKEAPGVQAPTLPAPDPASITFSKRGWFGDGVAIENYGTPITYNGNKLYLSTTDGKTFNIKEDVSWGADRTAATATLDAQGNLQVSSNAANIRIGTTTLDKILLAQKDGLIKVRDAIKNQNSNPTVSLGANFVNKAAVSVEAVQFPESSAATTPPSITFSQRGWFGDGVAIENNGAPVEYNGNKLYLSTTDGKTFSVREDVSWGRDRTAATATLDASGNLVVSGAAKDMKIGTKTLEQILKEKTARMVKVGKAISTQGANPTVTLRANFIEQPAAKKVVSTPTPNAQPAQSPTTSQAPAGQPATPAKVTIPPGLYKKDADYYYVDADSVTIYSGVSAETVLLQTVTNYQDTLNEQNLVPNSEGIATAANSLPQSQRVQAINMLVGLPQSQRTQAINNVLSISSKNPDSQMTFADGTFSKITSGNEQDGTKVSFKAATKSNNLLLTTSEETLKGGAIASKTTTITTNDATGKETAVSKTFDLLDKDGNLKTGVISYTSEHSSSTSGVVSAATEKVNRARTTAEQKEAAAAQAEATAKTLTDTATTDTQTAAAQAVAAAERLRAEAHTAAAELAAAEAELETAKAGPTETSNKITFDINGKKYVTETLVDAKGGKTYKAYKVNDDGSPEEVSRAEVYFAADNEMSNLKEVGYWEGVGETLFLSDAAKQIQKQLQDDGVIWGIRATMGSVAKFVGGLITASDTFSGLPSAFSFITRGKDYEKAFGSWKDKVNKEFTEQVVGMGYFKSKLCEKKFKNPSGQSFLIQKSGGEYKAGASLQVDRSEKTKVKDKSGNLVDGYIYRTTFSLTNANQVDMVYNLWFKTKTKPKKWFENNKLIPPGKNAKQNNADLTSKDKTVVRIFPSKADYTEVCLTFSPPMITLAGKKASEHCVPVQPRQGGASSYTKAEQKQAETPVISSQNDGLEVMEGD